MRRRKVEVDRFVELGPNFGEGRILSGAEFLGANFWVCEFFSGVGEIVKAAHSCGMGALGFEYLDDMQRQDFESPSGLQEALLMIQRCGPQSS